MPGKITAQTLILDILIAYPSTQAILAEYDRLAGVCICCDSLFDSVAEVAARCHVPVEQLVVRLNELSDSNI